MANYMEPFSDIKSSSILNTSEDNNDMFITGYNCLLANDDTRAARDFYLLLMVYVNCFCIPVFSFVLKGLCGFGKSVQCKFSERARFVYMAIALIVEDKEYISMLPSSRKVQVECILLSGNIYRKTVLL
jgi:hypothetical protein